MNELGCPEFEAGFGILSNDKVGKKAPKYDIVS